MRPSAFTRAVCVFLFLLGFQLSIYADPGARPLGSGPAFIVMPTTSRESAVLASYVVNEPSEHVWTRLSVTNLIMPAVETPWMGGPSPRFSYPGTLEFHLYSSDGQYYFYETSGITVAEKVGTGLDASGALGPGQTYTVRLAQLLSVMQAPLNFTGYAWVVGHFPSIQGTYTVVYDDVPATSSFAMDPEAAWSRRTFGTLGGIPRGPQDLVIGFLAEITGLIPAVGASSKNGAEMAVDEINQAGGIRLGNRMHRMRLITGDTRGERETAAVLAWDMITRTNAVAIVGPNSSGNAIPAADIAEVLGIGLITPWSTNPRTTLDRETLLPKKNVFRACFTDTFQGRVLSKFARERLQAHKAAVLYDRKMEVLKSQADFFAESFEEFGGAIVAFEEYETGETDFSEQFARIKAAGPDVIFLPSYYTDVPSQVRQARALGISASFLGSDAWSTPQLISQCGPDCEGIFLSNHYSPESENPRTRAFVAAYQARYGETPDDVAALTYDAFGLLRTAFENVGRTGRQAVLNGLRQIRSYQGVTGDMLFEPGSGDPIKGAVIMQIKDGKFRWYADVEP